MSEPSAIVSRLLEAFGTYDPDALAPLLADDVRHWLNITKLEQGRDEMLAQIAVEGAHIATSTFTLRHHVETAEGFVVQLTVAGNTKGGAAFEVPVCLVVAVEGNKVVRVDEYANVDDAKPIINEMFGSWGELEALSAFSYPRWASQAW